MTYGTGPQAVQQLLFDNWQATRSGRPDVPDLARDGNGDPTGDEPTALEHDNAGTVLILRDRSSVAVNQAVFDPIYVYQPEGNPGVWEDQGYKEEYVNQGVQVDIDLTDRPDHDTGERLGATERMVGDRGDASFSGADPPYHGILGEVKYCFELVRRGYEEYDTVSLTPLNVTLKNSDAFIALDANLEILAKNTVQ